MTPNQYPENPRNSPPDLPRGTRVRASGYRVGIVSKAPYWEYQRWFVDLAFPDSRYTARYPVAQLEPWPESP